MLCVLEVCRRTQTIDETIRGRATRKSGDNQQRTLNAVIAVVAMGRLKLFLQCGPADGRVVQR